MLPADAVKYATAAVTSGFQFLDQGQARGNPRIPTQYFNSVAHNANMMMTYINDTGTHRDHVLGFDVEPPPGTENTENYGANLRATGTWRNVSGMDAIQLYDNRNQQVTMVQHVKGPDGSDQIRRGPVIIPFSAPMMERPDVPAQAQGTSPATSTQGSYDNWVSQAWHWMARNYPGFLVGGVKQSPPTAPDPWIARQNQYGGRGRMPWE